MFNNLINNKLKDFTETYGLNSYIIIQINGIFI